MNPLSSLFFILSRWGGTMSLWNCGLLTELLSIAWTTDAWIWNISGMITKRRNWKTEKKTCPSATLSTTYIPNGLLYGWTWAWSVAIWRVTISHMARLIKSITFTHSCKSFPLFIMHFFPLYSFHLRFSLITLFLLFVKLSFSSASLFFLVLQCASFEPCLIKRTDVCPRTITTIQIPKHLLTTDKRSEH